MRTIIAGSRGFTNFDLMIDHMTHLPWTPTVILSGGARGADALGERWAKHNDIPVEVFPARWDLFGKNAGHRRDREMVRHAEALVAFWDGRSPGTKHMIEFAKRRSLRVHVIRTE